MRICVYGAGAIGGHLAVRLAQVPGNDVQVVARGAHLAAIRARGLTLRLMDTPLHARVPASDDIRELASPDVVLVTLKAHSIQAAAEDLAALAGAGAELAFVTNGIPWWYGGVATPPLSAAANARLDPAALRERFAAARLAGGVVYSPNTVTEPGVIACPGAYTHLLLGPARTGEPAVARRVAALLEGAGIPATAVDDLRPEIFRKLLLNSSLSPLCAIADATSRDVTGDPVLRKLCVEILHEVVALAHAQGVPLEADESMLDPSRLATHKSSMAQDLDAGRPLETDGILGNVQLLAREANLPTPALDLVTALVLMRARALIGR